MNAWFVRATMPRRLARRAALLTSALALLMSLAVASGGGAAYAQPRTSSKPSRPAYLVSYQDQQFTVMALQEGDVECGEGCIDYFDAPIYLTANSSTGVEEYGNPLGSGNTRVDYTYQGVSVSNAYNYFSDWNLYSELDFYTSSGAYVGYLGIGQFGCAVGYNSAYDCGHTSTNFNMYDYQGQGQTVHYEEIWVDDDFGWQEIWQKSYSYRMTAFCTIQPPACW